MGLLNMIILHILLEIISVFTSVEENQHQTTAVSKTNTVEITCAPEATLQTNDIIFQNIL
jgi:hypothetical protein